MRKPWEIWDMLGKLRAARNTLDDIIQLMSELAEQQQSSQKQSGKEEAAQPAILATRSDDSGGLLDIKAAAAYLGVSPSFVRSIGARERKARNLQHRLRSKAEPQLDR
jgi:transposase